MNINSVLDVVLWLVVAGCHGVFCPNPAVEGVLF